MDIEVKDIITVVVGVFAILAGIDSFIQRYNKKTTSAYAAERDFAHLQRSQEQLKVTLNKVMDESEAIGEEVIRLRTQMEVLIGIQRER